VKAKAVLRDGREIVSPEFEECKRIAREKGMPVLDVMRILEREISSRQ
jgi:pyridinium-3,5-bisthiocarboxylic acid mononucleotide nickel chelatase